MAEELPLEQAWARLSTHLEWASRFWLVFIFCDDPRVAGELRARAQTQLEGEAGALVDLRPEASEDEAIDGLIAAVLAGEGETETVGWIDMLRHDSPRAPGWSAAWERLLLRLNERRELLRRRWAGGGLVFVTTHGRLAQTPAHAPDLWTIRALVLRVAAAPSEHEATKPAARPEGASRGSADNLELARQAVARARARSEGELAAALLNLGTTLQAWGRREEATAATEEAVEHYRNLAHANPDAFLPHHATALNNLGVNLSSLGRREEAMAATEEAIEIQRMQEPDPE